MLWVGLGHIHTDVPEHRVDRGVSVDDHLRSDDAIDIVRSDDDRLAVQGEPSGSVLIVISCLVLRVTPIRGILRRDGCFTLRAFSLIHWQLGSGTSFIRD